MAETITDLSLGFIVLPGLPQIRSGSLARCQTGHTPGHLLLFSERLPPPPS